MNTFADLKRRLVKGTKLTMVRHDWYPNGKFMNVERTVIKAQGNAIAMAVDVEDENGSWLYWPKASEVKITGPDTFLIELTTQREAGVKAKYMGYVIAEAG